MELLIRCEKCRIEFSVKCPHYERMEIAEREKKSARYRDVLNKFYEKMHSENGLTELEKLLRIKK